MPTNTEMAGVEEVATVALQWRMFVRLAKLVLIPDIESQTNHWDDERAKRNQALIETKTIRSTAQLTMLELNPISILHTS